MEAPSSSGRLERSPPLRAASRTALCLFTEKRTFAPSPSRSTHPLLAEQPLRGATPASSEGLKASSSGGLELVEEHIGVLRVARVCGAELGLAWGRETPAFRLRRKTPARSVPPLERRAVSPSPTGVTQESLNSYLRQPRTSARFADKGNAARQNSLSISRATQPHHWFRIFVKAK